MIEADEYDTAFFDKRSKFVHYRPRTAILNNLEFDHADIFPDLAAIETQFHHFVRTLPPQGLLVVERRATRRSSACSRRGCWSAVERFGVADVPGTGPAGPIAVDGFGHVRRRAAGHACAGTCSARTTARTRSRRSPRRGTPAFRPRTRSRRWRSFEGVKRRMEVRGEVARRHGVRRFRAPPDGDRDDARGAARAASAAARIVAVIEPRSNTMKLGVMKEALPGSLAAADRVYCYAAASAGTRASALAPLGDKGLRRVDLDELVARSRATAGPAITCSS